MQNKSGKLIAAVALAAAPAVGLANSSEAHPLPPASSYSDLLQPIPNAIERLRASDAQMASAEVELIKAQYGPPRGGPEGGPGYQPHHHHHHHHHSRRWYRQHGYVRSGGQWMLRPVDHHHHHHHHHNY